MVVLEKGPHYRKEDFIHDEILTSRRGFFMPLLGQPHLAQGHDGQFDRTNKAWTANCGQRHRPRRAATSTALSRWTSACGSELGRVGREPHSWPIRYEDLEPFYAGGAEVRLRREAVPLPPLKSPSPWK